MAPCCVLPVHFFRRGVTCGQRCIFASPSQALGTVCSATGFQVDISSDQLFFETGCLRVPLAGLELAVWTWLALNSDAHGGFSS